MISIRHIRTIFTVALIATCNIATPPIALCKPDPSMNQTASKNYRAIMEDALSGTVCSANLKVIVEACERSDSVLDKKALDNGKGAAAASITRQVLSLTDRETKKIIDFAGAADTDPEDRARALYHFGRLMRTLQDFYFCSNYLELQIEDTNPANLDPYKIEPINWSRISRDPHEIATLGFEYGGIDKTSASEPEGAKTSGRATYFSMAKELALKETQRQWNTIERLIRIRYPQKATEISLAMKKSSCPADFKPGAVP
jgi:hypothetical protein